MLLKNRVVVVTGAASGIGRAIARRFAGRGALLHLIDLDAAGVEAVAVECGRLGTRASFHAADCRDPEAMRRIAAEVVERDAVIDVLVLNAGVGYGGRIADMKLEDWRLVLDTNLYGVIHGLDAFLSPMLGQKTGGHIIIMASVLGLFAAPRAGAYAASKHALVALADVLGAELRPQGITVTALCPGLVASNIVRRGKLQTRSSEGRARLERHWQKGAPPDEVARVAQECVEKGRGGVRLAAPYMTGMWTLRRLAPRLYERALGLAEAGIDWFDR